MYKLIDKEKEKLKALKKSAPQKSVSAFGILKGKSKIDGLEFQRKLRSEWDR